RSVQVSEPQTVNFALVVIRGADKQVRQKRALELDHCNMNVGRLQMHIEHSYGRQRVPYPSGLKWIRVRRIVDEDFILPGAIKTKLVLVYVQGHTQIEPAHAATNDRSPTRAICESDARSDVVVIRQVRLNVITGN